MRITVFWKAIHVILIKSNKHNELVSLNSPGTMHQDPKLYLSGKFPVNI